jgi:ammonia channel protein AmtB
MPETSVQEFALGLDRLWVLIAACLVFWMQAGVLCLEVGCVRTKNVTSVAIGEKRAQELTK